MNERDKIIERARKLLALADRNSSENEAAAAASKAQSLLAEHDLTIECVEDIDPGAADITEEEVDRSARMPSWRRSLLHGVARANSCSTLYCRHWNSTGLKIVGSRADVAIARAAYGFLCEVIERLTRRHAQGRGRSYASSFRLGCAQRLAERVRARAREHRQTVERAGRVTSTGRDLVVCKERALKEHMAGYGNVTHRPRAGSMTGYHRGRDAAESVNLSEQLGNGAEVAQIP